MLNTVKKLPERRNINNDYVTNRESKGIYKLTGLCKDDKQDIYREFEKLAALRNESMIEYSFDTLFEFWSDEGFSKKDVIDMIHTAKSLPKKGNTKLAAGDIVVAWKKTNEKPQGISRKEFNKVFKAMCSRNFDLMNKACIELTGIGLLSHNDKERTFGFLKKQMEAVELERSKVEYQNKINNDRAVVNWRERGELSLKAEMIITHVKLELIEWFLEIYERRIENNHPSPAEHLYELMVKLKKQI